MARYEEEREIEMYREGSDPKDYDVEYSVAYLAIIRFDDCDMEAEADGITRITYYPDPAAVGVEMPEAELRPEMREKLNAAVVADCKANDGWIRKNASRDYNDRRECDEGY